MNTITLPYWAFILLIVFAAIMVLDRILLPSVRWYLKRRVNKVIGEINNRLDIEIRPFQTTRRAALVEQLVFDEKVVDAVKVYAEAHDMPPAVAQQKARKYAQEIIPKFSAYFYFRIGYWLAKKVTRLIYRVRLGFYDNNALAQVDSKASIVFVMNHRSNIDYMLVSFLVAQRTTLSYAVGEWAKIWPLQSLIKSMGAFFVRRGSGNALYRKVLERYINMSTRAGVCQAVFPEGGLSRDGAFKTPKLGFLDYMLREYHPHSSRDIVFIPVGINYDRVMEDRTLLRDLNPDSPRQGMGYVLKTWFRFTLKTMLLSRKKRWRRFGYASVNFGVPMSAKEYCITNDVDFSALETEARFQKVGELADQIMDRIKAVVPVLPNVLMAEILLDHKDEWKSALALKSLGVKRIAALRSAGGPVNISESSVENILGAALDALLGRGLLQEKDNLYKVSTDSEALLQYYANSIAHWKAVEPQRAVTQ